ncbi:MAG: PTS lactose/cellobiose transporter subunit IIA [Lachnoclostridium edouardi]|uniref:PTS lactose/cellobiose transporter subunit IIA n=1 Tax=Lachnoclostridium edouardi TaxID=1926283 RepID=UPI0026DB7B1A|nr:PTS lactose/cellobiose transporter subunit IIA [Lachnoclostridium edouardi]MDO4277499.1 PTS lactose/cellobiose transporter subunit IIA [Lachnoclostridium edouardi]
MSYENIIMELIVKGGDARSSALMAIKAAREQDFEKAGYLMEECGKAIREAHQIQTTMIQNELNGAGSCHIDLLMIHGQDHLMNAMTIRDLAEEFIEVYKQLKKEGSV